jgi:predicted 3-demethylubiquinone-9 3-methyltransferase (glyoxalase superfamily)
MQKIIPFLWFNGNAEEAANFYVSVFKNSKIKTIRHWNEGGPAPAGTVMSVEFELEGSEFIAFNGGPQFQFSPSISLFVNCNTQEEVNELWSKHTEGGGEQPCGWLQDKFGLSWQIIPSALGELMNDKDTAKASRVMQAMLQMKKIDIKKLKAAYDGK